MQQQEVETQQQNKMQWHKIEQYNQWKQHGVPSEKHQIMKTQSVKVAKQCKLIAPFKCIKDHSANEFSSATNFLASEYTE